MSKISAEKLREICAKANREQETEVAKFERATGFGLQVRTGLKAGSGEAIESANFH